MTTENQYDEAWIETQAITYPDMGKEQIEGWFEEVVGELMKIGLDKSLGCVEGEALNEEFLEMVKGGVIGKIQSQVSMKPTDFKLMILGPYPYRNNGKKTSVEMIAYASQDGTNINISALSAWDEFVDVRNDVEPLGCYQTAVSFFEDKRKLEPNTFRLGVQKASVFSEETICEGFLGADYNERLAVIRNDIPKVNLGDINRSLSKVITNTKSQKSYPNTLDLKRVIVNTVAGDSGVDKNRRDWAMLNVVDASFKPTVKHKNITVWVDPSIYNRIQAGPGSYLEIFGTIQKRDDEAMANIAACFIHPFAVQPLEDKSKPQIDTQPGVVQTPEEPMIQAMSSVGNGTSPMCTSDGM